MGKSCGKCNEWQQCNRDINKCNPYPCKWQKGYFDDGDGTCSLLGEFNHLWQYWKCLKSLDYAFTLIEILICIDISHALKLLSNWLWNIWDIADIKASFTLHLFPNGNGTKLYWLHSCLLKLLPNWKEIKIIKKTVWFEKMINCFILNRRNSNDSFLDSKRGAMVSQKSIDQVLSQKSHRTLILG